MKANANCLKCEKKGKKNREESGAKTQGNIPSEYFGSLRYIYIHTHAHTFVYHQPRSPQQLAIQFVSAPSSPSLFVFSLTFFLTFSRVNSSQTNTLKKINRSVYFSLPPPPSLDIYFIKSTCLSRFVLCCYIFMQKLQQKCFCMFVSPFLFSPPFLIVSCVCPYAKRKIRYMHDINLYAENYNMKTKSRNFFVLLYFLRIAISFR